MYKILTLNNIAVAGLDRLPRDRYEVASEIAHPDAILVRSANASTRISRAKHGNVGWRISPF